jgi:coenzyme PQQ precursor peptide PqqA
VSFSSFSWRLHAVLIAIKHIQVLSSPKETTMKEWLKPEITESEAGMEVTSYLPAELDRA